jgi:hypothetical protein
MSAKDDRISELTEAVGSLTHDLVEAETTIEGLAVESDDRARTIEKLDAAIKAAMDDLRSLQHVPASQLLPCVSEIIGQLKAAL